MFSKILIANRGEVAVRIIRACKEMGIATVAVYSEADKDALHVSLADASYCIGGPLAKDSYLRHDNILSAAIACQAEAIHPGYGFLSENARFAALCAQHGISFIGPRADILEITGDKAMARKTMRDAGIPVIPGCDTVDDLDAAETEANKIGFPLLIKARSGGGGRGIRLVEHADTFVQHFHAAAAEAMGAFGDDGLYLEKYLSPVKHIEAQILADPFGNVLCLGERDCSVQRMNQKVIEESPAVQLSEEAREALHTLSVQAAVAIGYVGAGTIEYLYTQEGDFYFMEMNPRLQVEHPVSEMLTGIDIVKWQIRIAAGMSLAFTQEQINFDGHAIECRINAENPLQQFRPSGGKINMLHVPGGPWVRFDTAVYHGYTIPPFYDALIGKIIVHAKTRDEGIRKMKAALCELIIEGVEHNADFLTDILSHPAFEDGSYTTDLLR